MTENIRKSDKGGKTTYLNVSAWYNAETGSIHMSVPGPSGFVTTINADPKSRRGHPNLFGKLARALKEAGVPAPDAIEAD